MSGAWLTFVPGQLPKALQNDEVLPQGDFTDKPLPRDIPTDAGKAKMAQIIDSYTTGTLTMGAGKIKMSKKDFVKEHKNLIGVLKKGSKKALLKEAGEQSKELSKVLKGGMIKRGINNLYKALWDDELKQSPIPRTQDYYEKLVAEHHNIDRNFHEGALNKAGLPVVPLVRLEHGTGKRKGVTLVFDGLNGTYLGELEGYVPPVVAPPPPPPVPMVRVQNPNYEDTFFNRMLPESLRQKPFIDRPVDSASIPVKKDGSKGRGKGKGLVGAGIWDVIKDSVNPRKVINEVINPDSISRRRISDVSKGVRNDYPPSVRAFLEANGDKRIINLRIRRDPVSSAINLAFDVLSAFQWSKAKQEENFDKLFHLGLVATLEGNTEALIEKNEVIYVGPTKPRQKDSEIRNTPHPRDTSLATFLERGHASKGDAFFKYDPFNNNCQDFVLGLLKANGVDTPKAEAFIKQDVSSIVAKLPQYVGAVAKGITDIGAVANVGLEGGVAPGRRFRSLRGGRDKPPIEGDIQEVNDAVDADEEEFPDTDSVTGAFEEMPQPPIGFTYDASGNIVPLEEEEPIYDEYAHDAQGNFAEEEEEENEEEEEENNEGGGMLRGGMDAEQKEMYLRELHRRLMLVQQQLAQLRQLKAEAREALRQDPSDAGIHQRYLQIIDLIVDGEQHAENIQNDMARVQRSVKKYDGAGKAKSATRGDPKFEKQLHKVGFDSASYLKEARRKAKLHHYPYKLLGFANDGNHKLAIPDENGRVIAFGKVGYGDHLIYSHQEALQKVSAGTAEKKRNVFRKSHTKIKGDWKKNPFSPNSLALNILW